MWEIPGASPNIISACKIICENLVHSQDSIGKLYNYVAGCNAQYQAWKEEEFPFQRPNLMLISEI
jgi:hypothetical protein